MKPIYEISIPSITEDEAEKLSEKLNEKMGDDYHVVIISYDEPGVKTRIIYPEATFWGWWYNLWNF